MRRAGSHARSRPVHELEFLEALSQEFAEVMLFECIILTDEHPGLHAEILLQFFCSSARPPVTRFAGIGPPPLHPLMTQPPGTAFAPGLVDALAEMVEPLTALVTYPSASVLIFHNF